MMVKKSENTIVLNKRYIIGCTKKQISCIKGLSLRKINHVVHVSDTPGK